MNNKQLTNHFLLERSKLLARYAEGIPRKFDKVELQLDYPDCGWIDMHFKVNGEEKLLITASDVYEPFEEIREWLETMAKNVFTFTPSGVMIYDEIHNYNLYYEPIISDIAELYDQFHTNLVGLFYIYDGRVKQIVADAFCEIQDFVKSIYHPIISFADETRQKEEFVEDWIERAYNREWGQYDEDDPKVKDIFYNIVKSPFVETFISDIYQSRDLLIKKKEEEISRLNK